MSTFSTILTFPIPSKIMNLKVVSLLFLSDRMASRIFAGSQLAGSFMGKLNFLINDLILSNSCEFILPNNKDNLAAQTIPTPTASPWFNPLKD